MSHVVAIQTQIKDAVALRQACHRLGLQAPVQETVKLFSSTATGYAVRLPGWRYPVVCALETGGMEFDNFGGHWGDPKVLDQLLQA